MGYKLRKTPEEGVVLLSPEGDEIGTVLDVESAETLIGYLDAGDGDFTAAPLIEDGERQWAFVNSSGDWVAYTAFEGSVHSILSHLNRSSNDVYTFDHGPDGVGYQILDRTGNPMGVVSTSDEAWEITDHLNRPTSAEVYVVTERPGETTTWAVVIHSQELAMGSFKTEAEAQTILRHLQKKK